MNAGVVSRAECGDAPQTPGCRRLRLAFERGFLVTRLAIVLMLPQRWVAVGGLAALIAGVPLAAQPVPAGDGSLEQPYQLSPILVIGEPVAFTEGGGKATVLSGQTLTESGVATPRSLTAVIPNLTVFDANGDRLPRFSVRGLRENNFGYSETVTTIYLDGVPFFDTFSRGLPLFNVETAEFLHGPQGTRYGASRPGGVLNLYTRQPGNQWEAQGRVGGGNYATASVALGAGGPLLPDRVHVGVDGLFSRRDGYSHNLTLDSYPDDRETLGGRAQLHWAPSDQLDLTAAASVYRFDDGALAVRPIDWADGFHDLRQDYDGFNDQDSQTYSLRAAWRAEAVRMVNVTAFRQYDQDLTGDFDFSPVPFLIGFDRPELTQWSEEFRIESPAPDTSWQWSVGVFAAGRNVDRENGFTYGAAAGPLNGATQTTRSENRDLDLAAFGQVTWSPVEVLDLTVGLRAEQDERELRRHRDDPVTPPFVFDSKLEETFQSLQPKVGAAYRFNDNLESWFTVASGYQPGGFSVSQNDPQRAPFDPAESLHFELGIGGQCRESHLRASVLAYWTETRDYQVYRPVTPTEFEVLNADRARTLGAEAELYYEPVTGLEFRLAAGVAEAEFTDFTAPDPLTGQPLDLSGRAVNFVPEFTLEASATYRHESGVFASVGGTVVGAYWYDELNTREQPTYALLQARVGWTNQRFEVTIFGRNLLDEEYYANVLDLGPAGFVGTPGDPVLFGAEIAARF